MFFKKLTISILLLLILQNSYSQSLLAMAKDPVSRMWGYIDTTGHYVIKPIYSHCREFSKDGFAVIMNEKNSTYYFIDRKGNRLKTDMQNEKFEKAGSSFSDRSFSSGVIPVMIGGRWGVIDTTGKVVFPIEFDQITSFTDGYAGARQGRKFFLLHVSGKRKLVEYKDITSITGVSDGMVSISYGDYQGFLDTTGRVIVPTELSAVGEFSGGLAWIKQKGKYGYIDRTGKVVIECQFLSAGNFDPISGLAKVRKDEFLGHVDTGGKFQKLNDSETINNFCEGICTGRIGAVEGFYDKTGKWIMRPQFQDLRNFSNGYAAAKKGEYWGAINSKGEWLFMPQFLRINDFR
jgi:hypothetical protein